MKSILAYKCDQCDYMSSNPEDVERHEAKHYGLSLEEYKEWQALYDEAKKAAYTRNCTNTPETREQFDAVIKSWRRSKSACHCNRTTGPHTSCNNFKPERIDKE